VKANREVRAALWPGVGSRTDDDRENPQLLEQDFREICERLGERLWLLEGSSFLIVGAAGFIPSYIVDAIAYANDHIFQKQKCRLLCLDNFATGTPGRLSHLEGKPWLQLIVQDICAPVALPEPLQVDYVVHGASIPSPPVYRKYPLQTIDVNVQGTRNLLEFARGRGLRSFLYLSSSEVYGDPTEDNLPTPETYRGNVSTLGPRACYDESKRLAETLCLVYHRSFGVPLKIARPFNVYGPRLRLDDGRVISDFLRDALGGDPITVLSDGSVTRSFCYVTDAVTALLWLLLSDREGDVFNVGNDQEVTVRAVAEQVNALFDPRPGLRFGRSPEPDYLADSPRRRCPDLAKLRGAFPWQPLVSLPEGLRRTIQWHRHLLRER